MTSGPMFVVCLLAGEDGMDRGWFIIFIESFCLGGSCMFSVSFGLLAHDYYDATYTVKEQVSLFESYWQLPLGWT